ncbi:hypothetical protein [Rhizobium sp. Root1220]|uniref:hypothetical protein n=1 Tax=Rhizobium sp. Root1220 TaxID=1736432 RepID=UPI0006FFE0C1|nr:hypothetical protein [Rhizobium sp. Root1220]KQV81728.1 hypothetical protein ASC90_05320 [Rhizobium sp. Root1220]
MDSSGQRYDVICDPLDMWTVWDNQADEPASFGGQMLYGLTEGHAVEVAKIMNELYGRDRGADHASRKQPGTGRLLNAGGHRH